MAVGTLSRIGTKWVGTVYVMCTVRILGRCVRNDGALRGYANVHNSLIGDNLNHVSSSADAKPRNIPSLKGECRDFFPLVFSRLYRLRIFAGRIGPSRGPGVAHTWPTSTGLNTNTLLTKPSGVYGDEIFRRNDAIANAE